jgi:hydroxymethylbilane synthase
LTIAAVLAREDPRDALVFPLGGGSPEGLRYTSVGDADGVAQPFRAAPTVTSVAQPFRAATGVVGTGSPRRIAQLRRIFPDARFEPIRGNVDTRLRKLDAGEVDMLVLACAGLRRLGLAERISAPLDVSDCVPAPGQGIIAIEVRVDDKRTHGLVATLNVPEARTVLAAEQAVVAELGGGCQLPLGAFAELRGSNLMIQAVAASLDGTRTVHGEASGNSAAAVETGTRLAQDLASRGAMELLHS